jgi:hypothetical protein
MHSKNFGVFIIYNFALAILALLVFGMLRWMQIPAGHLIDWVIGAASFWWLFVIVTIPWNIYFQARETLAEAMLSVERGITVSARQIDYVRNVARRSLAVAITLHVVSAAALYTLAKTGVSPVGYVASIATLLLTALRPAVRAYEYLRVRLTSIQRQITYPREDIMELRARFDEIERRVEHLEEQADPSRPHSWAAEQRHAWETARQNLAALTTAHENLRAANSAEHDRLSRETEHAVAQLTADGQFLDHVREIIRFYKTA